jgi:hypothetical protein
VASKEHLYIVQARRVGMSRQVMRRLVVSGLLVVVTFALRTPTASAAQLRRGSEPSAGFLCFDECGTGCAYAAALGPEFYASCGAACLAFCVYEYGGDGS